MDALAPLLQIVLIDLLLSGDNALVIALACRGLPPRLWRRTVMLGTLAAIGLRVLLTAVAALSLDTAYLKLTGAVLLLAIAVRLTADDGEAQAARHTSAANASVRRAVMTIIVADTVMSLDNVLAVAAAARGSLLLLTLGLLLSIPILVLGSVLVARILQRFPVLVWAGAAQLGWIAGVTALSDPALATWLGRQPHALSWLIPLAGMVYVPLHGLILRALRRGRQGRVPTERTDE